MIVGIKKAILHIADVTSGLAGFLVMFFIFALIRGIFHALTGAFRKDEGKH